jgi:hypothetical protein
MTQHQYIIVKWLRRAWFLKRFFGNDWAQGIVTKQAEIELAGQAASKNNPPIDSAKELDAINGGGGNV